ncbi:rho guanine nucleotide exchange factor 7-like isoform X1 [Diadema antillarum]|uniref:rho guanine nucleotide exchange factor 7-like isoform X1 n=1 Tax=Diadema antillarum TaxID=105358 RepID=UPI003A87CEFA
MAAMPAGLITMGSEPLKQFRARFKFEGRKEDELDFNKGDVITVTLMVDGGWWEGMLNGRSGWFPSNYVKEIKPKDAATETKIINDNVQGTEKVDKLKYHSEVIEALLESEKHFMTELQTLISTYLRPLEWANVLPIPDWSTLCCNLEDILSFQQSLIKSIEEAGQLEGKHRRIGSCFMKVSTQYRSLYSTYCANHPKAVAVLTEHSDELSRYMEGKGAPTPGIMFLTTGLSSPFRKLEKYTAVLKELERHLPAGHPDKIDMSTAISVYKEIATHCQMMRKRKEIELDIMTGPIQGWEGEQEIQVLGEVHEMVQGTVMVEGTKSERFFLVFHQYLVILSPTSGMNGFIFLGKHPVTSVKLSRLPDTEKEQGAFEVSAPGLEKTKVLCQSVKDREQLFDAIEMAPSRAAQKMPTPIPSPAQCSSPPPIPAPQATGKAAQPDTNHITSSSPILQGARDLSSPVPMVMRHGNVITCLRPAPPVNPVTIWARKEGSGKSPKGKRRMLQTSKKKDKSKNDKGVDSAIIQKLDSQVLEEDNRILKVIEAYCTSAGTRNASNSVPVEAAPHVFLAEDEKIIVEETKGSETVVEEKTLVDTVYALRDQVKDLMDETKRLKTYLDDERKARRRLETSVRHSIAKYDKFDETNL